MKWKEYVVKLRNLFINQRNSVFGSFDYEKFIVITRSRTGSNLLMSFLDSHPEIIAKGEVFNRLNEKTTESVWSKFFTKKPKEIKYAGFKIFYYHPMDCENREVWNIIGNNKSIKLIHLTRKNILKTVISREIAAKTDVWTNKDKHRIDLKDKQISVSIEECMNEIQKTKEYEEKTRNDFKNHALMELTYEDLVENNQKLMNEVFRFLGVEATSVNSNYKKQNNEELRDLILNYSELSESLQNTKWVDYLNDN